MPQINYQYCPQCQKPMGRDEKAQPICAACNITVYRNVVAGVSIAPVKDGKVLLARRGREPYKGTYDLIGGFMDPGETAEQTAIREAKEETGLDIVPTELLGYYSDQYGDDGSYTFGVCFIGTISGGHAQASDDVSALEWVQIRDIDEAELGRAMKNVQESLRDLKLWLAKQSRNEETHGI